MSELAQLLKKRREEKGLTLSQISKDTKIRVPFLADIEEGNYKALPSYLHCYGFVKKYAEYLGFSYDEIKDLFSSECPKPGSRTEDEENAPEVREEPRKNGLGPWIAAAVVVIICAALWFGYQKRSQSREAAVSSVAEYSAELTEPYAAPAPAEEIRPAAPAPETVDTVPDNMTASAAPAPVDNASAAETAPVSPVAETAAENVARSPQAASPEAVPEERSVVLYFSDRCWIKFVSDNGDVQDFLADPGTSKTLPFYNSFTIDIGNAAAVTMTYGTQTFSNYGGPNVPLSRLRYAVENGALVRAAR